jgi:hypothetical protein
MALSKIVENSIATGAVAASKLKDFTAAVDLNGVELILDADADTSITADTDDQIDIKISGSDDFRFTANTFTALAGSSIVTPTLTVSGTVSLPAGATALTTLDIDGATDIGAAIVDADLFIVDDGAGGSNRKTTAARIKTYVGGGITEADIWRLSASFTGSADPIASNWERADDTNTGYLGSGMSESSGIFTFPSTGIWRVNFNFAIYSANSSGDDRAPKAEVHISPDSGSNYDSLTNVHLHTETISSNYTHNQGTCFCLVDVTNASNFRAKFVVTTLNSGTSTFGQSDKNQTCVEFIRLGDT